MVNAKSYGVFLKTTIMTRFQQLINDQITSINYGSTKNIDGSSPIIDDHSTSGNDKQPI